MTSQTAAFSAESRSRSLSPSRAADFKTCPLLYRLRTIDRLPQRPSAAATRGTLVHAVLERLYELPAVHRTAGMAKAMIAAEWRKLLDTEPELEQIVAELRGSDAADDGTGDAAIGRWLASAAELLDSYFALEDPTRIAPEGRELTIEFDLGDGPVLRGIIDRLDATAAGDLRIVDYKTGVTPHEAYEAKALFQMKFYALMIYRTRGVVPRQLRLLYLGDRDMLSYAPDVDELDRFEHTLRAIWAAIQRGVETKDFRPSPGRMCTWCDYRPLCPAWGGTPPPYPDPALTDSQLTASIQPGRADGPTPE